MILSFLHYLWLFSNDSGIILEQYLLSNFPKFLLHNSCKATSIRSPSNACDYSSFVTSWMSSHTSAVCQQQMTLAGRRHIAKLCVCSAVHRYCSIARGIVMLQGKVFIVNSIVNCLLLFVCTKFNHKMLWLRKKVYKFCYETWKSHM